jgi:hypothetical protein
MRVELIHTPGCNRYKKTLELLQTVIAEERLPLHVEVTEENSYVVEKPCIRIDGDDLGDVLHINDDPCSSISKALPGLPCVEKLRELLCRKWDDITRLPALGS